MDKNEILLYNKAKEKSKLIITYGYAASLSIKAVIEIANHSEKFFDVLVLSIISPLTLQHLKSTIEEYSEIFLIEECDSKTGLAGSIIAEMNKIKEELQDQKDKYLRLYAEFDNFRRRSAKERIEYTQTAGQEVIKSMLEVLDDCSRVEKMMYMTEDPTIIREGVQLVFNKLKNTLTSKGVKVMETIGTEFNADIHEAITEIPSPSEDMVGKVIDEVEKGYYLNDKIIRYAKVVIGK
jgi:molecular chaperone GrpE